MVEHKTVICWFLLTSSIGYMEEELRLLAVVVGHQAGLHLASIRFELLRLMSWGATGTQQTKINQFSEF